MSEQIPPDRYIPALSFRWLTPIYDPLLKWVMHEETFKRLLIDQAHIQSGYHVLDLGCGTGTLTILLKQLHPAAVVIGVDGDRQVLQIARGKVLRAGLEIAWDFGLAYDLPYPSEVFDRVISSLVIHHLTTTNKRRAFEEVLRVLKPGGEFHIVDFGAPHTLTMHLASGFMRHLEQAQDNFAGKLPGILKNAGFSLVSETNRISMLLGPLSLIQAIKS